MAYVHPIGPLAHPAVGFVQPHSVGHPLLRRMVLGVILQLLPARLGVARVIPSTLAFAATSPRHLISHVHYHTLPALSFRLRV